MAHSKFTIIRQYEPDPERCVQALVRFLSIEIGPPAAVSAVACAVCGQPIDPQSGDEQPVCTDCRAELHRKESDPC